MKAIIKFNLPDDQQEYDRANAASRLCSVLWEYDQWLRSEIKYNESEDSEIIDGYQKARDKLYEVMSSEDINLDKIYA